jgi:hypothetical protein
LGIALSERALEEHEKGLSSILSTTEKNKNNQTNKKLWK